LTGIRTKEPTVANIFPKWINRLRLIAPFVLIAGGGAVVGGVWYFGSPLSTDVGYRPSQPVAYSHKQHAGDLGIDCRYCHVLAERSPVAGIPPTQLCMNCHTLIGTDSDKLSLVRQSSAENKPIEWVRVHELPGYAYFDHSLHLSAGVGCVSCHGRVDQMEVVTQQEPLSMGWCLDCHRNPKPNLRPVSEITNMTWETEAVTTLSAHETKRRAAIDPPQDCTACHR
jgi:hypothetical protein